jgi:Dolichyl-phosphate-mannose-protein mannosyltransferase
MTSTPAPPAPSARAWAAVGFAALASLALLFGWLLGTSTGNLREQLKVWQFWSLDATVLLGVLIGVYIWKTVPLDVDKRDLARMAAAAALGVALTLFAAPRTNRIFYDEQIYQSVGQNLADLRLAQVCNDGSVEYGRLRCASGEYNKQPYGYPHALSLAYRLFGAHAGTAFGLNAVAMGLTVCAVYLLVWVLFRDRDAALFAGLLMALTPEQLIWSATAAVEPSASLASVTAVLGVAHYLRTGGWAALVAAVVAAAYAIQFRPESLLILPVVGFLAWPRIRQELARPRAWWAAILFLWLGAMHVGHLYAVRHIGWGTDAARFSLDYIATNLPVNGWFYLYDERFPFAFTLLAMVGLLAGPFRRERASMAIYFLAFFAIGLVFYAGSYNYGADVRYSLMTYPPVAVLGGLGASQLARSISRLGPGVPGHALTATLLASQFLWYAPVVRATTEEGWAARADVAFAQAFARELPPNSYVLTHNPGMFHLWNVNAGQMSQVVAVPAYTSALADRYAGGIYLHWNFWCNVQDPAQQEVCRRAMATAPAETVREYRERDQHYALYRLKVRN